MNLLLDLLFPKKCVGCGQFETYFCKDCILNILQKDLICPECDRLSLGGQTHSICRKQYGLDGLWSLGWYQGALRKAIKQLKYQRVRNLAEALGDLLADYFLRYKPFVFDLIKKDKGKWVVTAVPLHWWRGNQRGFNQSVAVGQNLSKKLGLGYYDALKRIRYTRPQVKLRGKDRHYNIRGAFAIAKPYTLDPKPYTLLIDDVWTTGSTLRECGYVLKAAGAKKVWAITLAR